MKESTLLKLSLVTSVLSLVVLFFLLRLSSEPARDLGTVKELGEGEGLVTTGYVQSYSIKNGVTIISLRKTDTVTVVAFENVTLKKDQKIEVVGKVQDYKGKKEIVADKITVKA